MDYFEKLCATKFENLGKMDKLLEKYKLTKMIPPKHKNMNNPNTYDLNSLPFFLSHSLSPSHPLPLRLSMTLPGSLLLQMYLLWGGGGKVEEWQWLQRLQAYLISASEAPKWENLSLMALEYKTPGKQMWKLHMSHSTPRVGVRSEVGIFGNLTRTQQKDRWLVPQKKAGYCFQKKEKGGWEWKQQQMSTIFLLMIPSPEVLTICIAMLFFPDISKSQNYVLNLRWGKALPSHRTWVM